MLYGKNIAVSEEPTGLFFRVEEERKSWQFWFGAFTLKQIHFLVFGVIARWAKRVYWRRFGTNRGSHFTDHMTSEDGTNIEFRNGVSKLASPIVQKPKKSEKNIVAVLLISETSLNIYKTTWSHVVENDNVRLCNVFF